MFCPQCGSRIEANSSYCSDCGVRTDTARSRSMRVRGRPGAITTICVIGFIGAVLTIPIIFSDAARSAGPWYPAYLALSGAVGIPCFVGLWMMKRWSIIAYTALFALNQIVLSAMGFWNIFALLIPAVVIVVGFFYFNEMD